MRYAQLRPVIDWCQSEDHANVMRERGLHELLERPAVCMEINGAAICVECIDAWFATDSALVELLEHHNARVEAQNAVQGAERLMRTAREAG